MPAQSVVAMAEGLLPKLRVADWLDRAEAEFLNYTVIDAPSVLITHLKEVLRQSAHELLTLDDGRTPPHHPLDDLVRIGRLLLRPGSKRGPETMNVSIVAEALDQL